MPKLRHTRNKANPLRLTLERVFFYPRQGRGRATLDRRRQTGQTTADTHPARLPDTRNITRLKEREQRHKAKRQGGGIGEDTHATAHRVSHSPHRPPA